MSYLKHILQKFGLRQKAKEQPAPPAYPLELAYEADGVRAYKFKNPLMLPKCRFALLGQALNDASLNMTKEDASVYFQNMKNAANNGQWADVMTLINAMEFYMSQHTTTRTLQAVANALIVIEGEPHDKISVEWMERKGDLFKKDLNFRGFFLRWGYIYLLTFSNQSVTHSEGVDYLKKPIVKRSEALFMRLLTENTAKDTKENKTLKSTD